MIRSRIILFFIIILTTFVYANPFSTYKEHLNLSNTKQKSFYVVNPIQDRTMSRSLQLNDSLKEVYISNVFNIFPASVDYLEIENSSLLYDGYIVELVDAEDESIVLDRYINLYTSSQVGRSNITLTAYADSTGVDSASDTFHVAVEDTIYQWHEGGSAYSFQPQYCVGIGGSPWKAAAHFSLGSESYILKEIEFGFALSEKIEWRIVEFNEVPDSIIIGDYVGLLDVNPTSPTYQVIDASSATILTGEIAIVFSSEGNFMSLDPNAESTNTWIWDETNGWALANSYTSAYDGAWYSGIQLEKIIDPSDLNLLDEGFETGSFKLENWDTYWEVKHNTAAGGGLSGANLFNPLSDYKWVINDQNTYINSGDHSAMIAYNSPDFNWLISPKMQLDYDDYILKFWLWFKSSDFPTKFNVMVDDGTKGWTSILTYDGSTPDNMYDSEVEVPLAAFVGKAIRIAFVTEENEGNHLAVDDIKVWSQTVGIHEAFVPSTIKLEQNYPNPFNPTTEINFTLNHNSLAKLIVFNSSGEIVKTLNNGKLTKGRHSFNFEGNDLNSGLYFYQLEVDGIRSTKKMILMK